jgi:hypothetical protein
MSLWDSILNDIKGWGSSLVGSATTAGTQIASQQVAGTEAPQTVQALQGAAQQAIANAGVKTAPQASSDLLLAASKPVGKAVSEFVNRPISTIGLLTDPNSPLYQDGFQLSDVKKAYDRSAKVSPFQALTKSSIFQDSPFGMLADPLLKEGNVNLQKVNLWDDKNIQNNFVDNPVGKWFTGTGDFVLSNVALGAVGGVTKSAIGGALKATNLTTSITSAADLARMDAMADSHISFVQTKQLMGKPTVFGADVQQLADTKDMNLIVNKVRQYSNNELLPSLIQKADNPTVVKNLILADKNYMPAIEALGNTAPHDLWTVNDTNSFIAGNVAATDKLPVFEGEALQRTLAAFDSAIAESPAHKEIYDAFMTPTGELKGLGNDYKPVDPKFFADQIGSMRNRMDELKAATTTRDFGGIGGTTETILGNNLKGPITKLIRFVGTYKPRGYITFTGARAWDGVDEMNAMFDDIRTFTQGDTPIHIGYEEVNGQLIPTKIPASQYRNQWLQKFMDAQGPSEKAAVIDELDKQLGHDLGRTLGFYDKSEMESFVIKARNKMMEMHNTLSKDGFAFDSSAHRIVVDPQTQRQLADSMPMLPWGKIERDMKSQIQTFGKITEKLPGNAHSGFESLNKLFSMSVLGRPAYIPKNSMIEPLTASFLSLGTKAAEDTLGSTASNFIKNNKNRIMNGALKIGDKLGATQLKAINQNLDNTFQRYGEATDYLDTVAAEYEDAFNTNNLSPAAKAEHLETIKANLRDAERLVGRIEVQAVTAAKNYGVVERVPSVYGLTRRLDFLNSQPSVAGKYGSEINSAKVLLQKAVGNITTLSPNIAERNLAVEKAWKVLDNVASKAGVAVKEQGEYLAEREANKKRFYGSTEGHVFNIGGRDITTENLFDPNKFGEALRSEFSNEDTQELNFLGELRTGSKVGLLARKGPTGVVDVNNPIYFEELAYVVNRQMRGDPLVDKVLSGQSNQEIYNWARTREGVSYLRQFGLTAESDMTSIVADRINFVKRYLPDDAARLYATKGDVTSAGLQKLLGDKTTVLSPIHPLDIDYGSAATLGKMQALGQSVTDSMNHAWKYLASAENPYRWIWADKKFGTVIEKKLNLLNQQGVPLTAESVNALRQASYREALDEAGKIFYNIRRQNRALYAARTVAAFPSASANSLYRFGRLGIKYPERMAGLLRNYNAMYTTFGVDKDGNPVANPSDAAYIVIPGTKEMGLYGGQGVRLSTKAVGFLANLPGPSWLTTMAVGELTKFRPDNSQVVKSLVDNTIGHIPGMDYNSLFPMGVDSSVGSNFVPSWLSDAKKYLMGSDSSADFLQIHRMELDYQMTKWEMGLGPKPTMDSVMRDTKNWFGERALWRFGSPIGIAPKQDKPGQLFQDYATLLLKKYNGDANKAQVQMRQVLGDAFPADRYLYRGSTRSAFISPTVEGYARVWQNNTDLAKQLEQLDPKAVGLLTADVTGDPDPQVQKFLSNPGTKLPGNTILNKESLTPQQYETNLKINRVWSAYRNDKQNLLDQLRKATNNPKARVADYPEVKAQWDARLAQLSKYSPEWWDEYQKSANGDNSYTMAKGLQDIINNPKFMQKNGSSDFWQQAKTFITYRNKVVTALASPEVKDAKATTALKQAWQSYLQNDTAGLWNPQLQEIIDRYFVNDSLKGTM